MATAVNGVRITPNLRSGNGGWFCDIRIRHPVTREVIRERIVVRAANKTEARRLGEQRRDQILAQGGKAPATQVEVPTLFTFKVRFVREHLVAERRKPSSIEAVESIFRNHIAPILGAKRLDEIADSDVQALKAALANRHSKTVNNTLAVLGSMLRRALDWGLIERVPRCKLLRLNQAAPGFYDFAEYQRLVEAAHKLDPRIELVVLLGGDAGLRRGEIISLEWSDLDFRRNSIHVQRSEWEGEVTAPKGGRSRRVPMTKRLAAVLQAHRHLRGSRVLYRDGGGTPTKKVIRSWLELAEKRAGFPVKGRCHVLRHTFCSHLAMQGAPAKAIQELAGHSTLVMTQRYMHLSPAAKDAAIALLDDRPAENADERGTNRAQPAPVAINPNVSV